MTPEQSAAVARIREAVEQANLCMLPLPTIIVATEDAAAVLAALDVTNKQSVPALSSADSQKLGEARQLAHNMVSHPVAFSTIDHVEEAGNSIMELLAALDAAQATIADLIAEKRTGEPHIDGWPLYSGLPQREVPRLTDTDVRACVWGYVEDSSNIDPTIVAIVEVVESRVRELCGVAP